MNKKISLGVTISLIAIGCAITFVLTITISLNMFNDKVAGLSEREEMFSKLQEVDTYVRANAITEIDEKNLLDGIIYGYVAGLGDKYAAYIPADSYYQVQQMDNGILLGIGIDAMAEESGYIRVAKVYEGSPAKTVGIQVDDVIIEIDGQNVKTLGYSESVNLIKGEEGTRISVIVRRSGEDIPFNLIRQKIEVASISSKILDEIAYIRIISFNSKTPDEFKAAINNAKAVGVKGFVFDLRQNTGGSVDALRKMLDVILPSGIVATAEYKNGVISTLIECVDDDVLDYPMITIGDGRSASASELFICALRDAGVSKMVGTTTYGKEVMQFTHELKDGSAITVTAAKCYTTKTEFYDGIGISPDYAVELASGVVLNLDTIDPSIDAQLTKALEIVQAQIDTVIP